jgi:hypothetical protein
LIWPAPDIASRARSGSAGAGHHTVAVPPRPGDDLLGGAPIRFGGLATAAPGNHGEAFFGWARCGRGPQSPTPERQGWMTVLLGWSVNLKCLWSPLLAAAVGAKSVTHRNYMRSVWICGHTPCLDPHIHSAIKSKVQTTMHQNENKEKRAHEGSHNRIHTCPLENTHGDKTSTTYKEYE